MLAPLLKQKGNLLESPKLVHLFWVQNVQTSCNQDMCYFKHKGLKTVFINLVTRPKLLLVGDEKSDPGDKAACSHCTVLERHCVAGKGAMLSGETSFLTGE